MPQKFRVKDSAAAFSTFQDGLRRALSLSEEELDRRVAEDNAARSADRVQRGYAAKRGPKKKTSPSDHASAIGD